MNNFFTPLGGMFLVLAFVFLMGLLNPFAHRFYPGNPGVLVRSAAPVIFAGLALTCFMGMGLPAMLTVATVGITLTVINRRRKQRVGI
jgi:hypothetical protein